MINYEGTKEEITAAAVTDLINSGCPMKLAEMLVLDGEKFAEECATNSYFPTPEELEARYDGVVVDYAKICTTVKEIQAADPETLVREALESGKFSDAISPLDFAGKMCKAMGIDPSVVDAAMEDIQEEEAETTSEDEDFRNHMDYILESLQEGGPMVAAGVVHFMENGRSFEEALVMATECIQVQEMS